MNGASPQDGFRRMSLGDHLEELRWRLLYALIGLVVAMAISLVFTPDLIRAMRAPYASVMHDLGKNENLIVLDVTGGFTTYLKVAMGCGVILSAPWWFYQLWAFLSAGLYPKERRYVLYAVPACTGLFLAGAAFFLGFVAKQVLYFMLSMSSWLGMEPMITFASYLQFILQLTVAFGLAFQTPLIILGLRATGILKIETLRYYRRHVIVAILVFAALFTPPDVYSQILLAVPMWLLYELGILLSVWLVRK